MFHDPLYDDAVFTRLELLQKHNSDVELNKKKRDTKLIKRRFEDILSSLSSEKEKLKFKGANKQYVNLHEQFRP